MRKTAGILVGVVLTAGVVAVSTGRTAHAAKPAQSCFDAHFAKSLKILKRRFTLTSGFQQNEIEHVRELQGIAKSAAGTRALSENSMRFASTALPVLPLFGVSNLWSKGVYAGLSGISVLKSILEKGVVSDEVQGPDSADDVLGPAVVFTTAEAEARIEERLAFFQAQHDELSTRVDQILNSIPNGLWGRMRNGLTLGADDEKIIATQLLEAEYRYALYRSEKEYSQRLMIGISRICSSGNRDLLPYILHLL